MKVDPALAGRLMEQEARFGTQEWHPLEVVCSRGDGVYLWDVQGTRYMDFLAAGGTVNQGHSHTRIAAAMVEQCLRLALPSRNYRNDRLPPLLEKLCTLTGFEAAILANTGAEAVEAAIMAVRRWACQVKGVPQGKAEVLVFSGNDHGSALAFGAFPPEGEGESGPCPPGFLTAPFGDLAAARSAVGPNTCAILVEPIQGTAGLRIPPKDFLRGLRDLCDAEGMLLLADEIQSGLGRTGKLFAFEHEGIRPDGALLGKALAGGFYPVSAFLASRRLLDLFTPGAHRPSFGGNPLACAVTSAALDVLTEDRLVDRSAELGAYFLARLRSMDGNRVKDIRGLGLWAGLELGEEPARPVREALAHEGLLCGEAGEHTLLLSPPLMIAREQLDWALEKLEKVLTP